MRIQKRLWCLARTRGNRTDYFYGTKLSECLKHCRVGDVFAYVKYEHSGERLGEMTSPGVWSGRDGAQG
jgi:hypothetical protein